MQDASPESPALAPSAWRPAALFGAAWTIGALSLVAVLAVFRSSQPNFTLLWDDSLRALIWFYAAWACGRRHREGGPYGPMWKAFALAMLFRGVGTLYVVVCADILGVGDPWITFRHLPYLLGGLFMGLAVLRWPTHAGLRAQRLLTMLDGLLIAAATFFIAWDLFLRQLLGMAGSRMDFAPTWIYPSLAIATATIWLRQLRRSRNAGPRGSRLLLGAAVGMNVIHWSTYSLLRIGGAYEGRMLAYLVSFLGLATALCLGLAALWPRVSSLEASTARTSPVNHATLPFLPALAAIVYAGIGFMQGRRFDEVSIWTGLGFGLLLCGRLYLALRQLQELSESLEARVEGRTRDLEEAQATLSRTQHLSTVAAVAAGIAHDFKNLAGAIQSYADLALADHDEKGAAQREDLVTIREAAGGACAMASQLMDYGRNQSGNEELLDLTRLVKDRARVLQGLAGQRARIRFDISEVPLITYISPTQMEQILVNLVVNALDAMPEGGTLTVATSRNNGTAQLSVSDTGTGMAPEVQARVFEPFYTTKAPGMGTGLGMASVKAIVSQMGGRIEMESRLGVGTTFTILLPLRA